VFSSDFLAMMLKYNNDVAGFVTEKAKRKCKEQVQDVSIISMFLLKKKSQVSGGSVLR
jgi:ketosteroid isomerase-like protein